MSGEAFQSDSFLHALTLFCFVSLLFQDGRCQTQSKTDPEEASALNKIIADWGISVSAEWDPNIEPCVGAAIDDTNYNDFETGIKCDCRFNNGTVCHITQLKASGVAKGSIPEELKKLTYLFNLNLSRNYFTGPLPAFLGSFSNMQYLNLYMNSFTGDIPKELGKLTKLISLALGSNSFSGSLPPELGNLTNLKQLYIESSGIGGEIPPTFSQLRKLEILWASDNNLTGKIPYFIGEFTNLTVLRLQGNSLQGPIPSSFVNLTKLEALKIGELTNESTSLAFIQNMKSLDTLVLRNCKISDTIPLNFGAYSKLQILDLSFNNLTGQLPQSLFNSSSLSFLFLGNNSLSGSLPNRKSAQLLNIDLSYNMLSGSFPSWMTEEDMQLNLVANKFVFDNSNISVLSQGLHCLQQNFPSNCISPKLGSSFAINCGGNESSDDEFDYDADNETLTSASYYITNTGKWAVSNVGSFSNATDATYIQESGASRFTDTRYPVLFRTARLSFSSLRYYGLDLENGNYEVKLLFAESAFPGNSSWQSLGRRVFDIYIQGILVEKDFDIIKEAEGMPFRAIERMYHAYVTNNFLDIHFFWAGKGTCCIPSAGNYGPSISAISAKNTSSSSHEKSSIGVVVGSAVGVAALCALLLCLFSIWRKNRPGPGPRPRQEDDIELQGLAIKPDIFSYSELRAATENFSPINKLGVGGFGPVFKGQLSDGRMVAVKQLSTASLQGKEQFVTEIATISAVQHRNLVKLYGCCFEGERRLLVYEYLENKSLDQALFGKIDRHLDWPSRFSICLNTAKGLAYLHEESSVRIVHRDVKASNILLDHNLNPKISDFGLARMYDDNQTHISTNIAGTLGYLAPEYALKGHLTEKADVYGFGVVVLEILSGRPNTDTRLAEEKAYLVEWAWDLHDNNRELELVDPKLSWYDDEEEVIRALRVALMCTQSSASRRPPMSRVVKMLAGDIDVENLNSKSSYVIDRRFSNRTFTSVSATMGSEDSSFHRWSAPSQTSSGTTAEWR